MTPVCSGGTEAHGRGAVLHASLLFIVFAGWGCADLRTTNPERTATEQFLLSHAAQKAVEPLFFDPLHARRVYVDSTYFASIDKDFVLGELRSKLLLSGVHLVDEAEEAEVILEVRSGGVGIDLYKSLLGIPSFGGPAAVATGGVPAGTVTTPELAILKKTRQVSFASVAYVAYWRDTGEVLAASSPSLGSAYREDWWILGSGPNSLGTIPPVNYRVEKEE